MQGGRRGGDPFFNFGRDPFSGFGGIDGFGFPGFERHRNLAASFFGGRDPFDDPFFTRPFGGSMFDSFGHGANFFPQMQPATAYIGNNSPEQPKRLRGPVIQELDSGNEEEAETDKVENSKKHRKSNQEPFVEVPDDETGLLNNASNALHMQYRKSDNGFNNSDLQSGPRMVSFQSSTVTYGGPNGAYYTSSSTRRTGSDGITLEESREADSSTRQATHRISRGINNKGHSVTRKLKSDGMVNTMQTLHNLNEDELSAFEASWNGKARQQLPGWSENFGETSSIGGMQNGSPGRLALPSTHPSQYSQEKFNGSKNNLRWKARR